MKGKEYAEQCRKEGLDNLVFLPPVSKTEVPAVLKASDVCIATLKDIELFKTVYPNKVFDYMAAKKTNYTGYRRGNKRCNRKNPAVVCVFLQAIAKLLLKR